MLRSLRSSAESYRTRIASSTRRWKNLPGFDRWRWPNSQNKKSKFASSEMIQQSLPGAVLTFWRIVWQNMTRLLILQQQQFSINTCSVKHQIVKDLVSCLLLKGSIRIKVKLIDDTVQIIFQDKNMEMSFQTESRLGVDDWEMEAGLPLYPSVMYLGAFRRHLGWYGGESVWWEQGR